MAAVEPLVRNHYDRSEELGQEITELCGYINAATCELLVKIREFDQEKLWNLWGICSCAHWLNWKCGIGMNAAREKVRVARALGELPQISESFSKGELSYSKVRAMTRVATVENEDYLLSIAHHGTAHHVESLVAKYRRARRLHESKTSDEQYQDRSLKIQYDDDGALIIKGRFPAEQGAMILKALQRAMDRAAAEDAEADVTAETRQPFSVHRADALAEMAESYLANGPAASSTADRYQVMLHVSAETLQEDTDPDVTAETSTPLDEEISHLEDGPHVSAETSRRICCDSSVSPIVTGHSGEPLSIGRKSRVIPPPMRRALRTRDDGCRFPGCTHKHFIDGHHIRHWADGGETSLDNLVLLCRHHHRLVHEGGFACEKSETNQLLFRDERGEVIGISGTVPAIGDNPKAVRRIRNKLEELHIDALTCVSDMSGGHIMDYAMALDSLWYRDYPRWQDED